ncbi:zinc-binding dehydrogenase [Nocardia puris]|uniref:Threonine dehydrogenase-like Zn-dependent dehydrogenase n=1 Tax=Nocardia puris TaxID=208602 RepID=A0A366DCZ1_9NOCA|nr:zinc-binding dehydrogenase [Nocardia puris]MBF6214950.1 zinc-binding dehydrogenase [Nocardia puris]MBF6364794.1 zinc-binding dehydrogenase [Nocardia puris]MBF6460235.1 zinc-binding dehydrogenase [Nocardia puris]RBO87921.1 threonine dehydrogenase-like Zn-dependent dehydrogenase [Nocardia puris]
MRAAVVTDTKFSVERRPTPQPGRGQVLLNVLRCGICGSDLHARAHADEMADLAAASGYDEFMRAEHSVVLGHEFSGEVVDYGPGCRKRWRPGTKVVALPILRESGKPQLIGLSPAAPGAYAEQVVVQESMTMPVPNGLSAELAAFTEPMAVAWHAVRKGQVGKGRPAFVIGCGPIGLAVISMLKAAGVRTVVASDFSPRRRDLAAACGADVVVDPAVESPWEAGPKPRIGGATDLLTLAFDTMEQLRRIPNLPWWYVFRAAGALGAAPTGPVIFECVGVPGVIDQIIAAAPPSSRVVVVGVCMETDRFHPALAVNKEIELRFALGYDPGEFRDTLHMIADGKVDPRPLLTGTVGLAGVANAFDALANPEHHAKILIDPGSGALEP